MKNKRDSSLKKVSYTKHEIFSMLYVDMIPKKQVLNLILESGCSLNTAYCHIRKAEKLYATEFKDKNFDSLKELLVKQLMDLYRRCIVKDDLSTAKSLLSEISKLTAAYEPTRSEVKTTSTKLVVSLAGLKSKKELNGVTDIELPEIDYEELKLEDNEDEQ